MHMIVMIDQTQRIVNRKRSFCALLLACLANTYHNRILFLECQEHIRSEFRLRTSQKMRLPHAEDHTLFKTTKTKKKGHLSKN